MGRPRSTPTRAQRENRAGQRAFRAELAARDKAAAARLNNAYRSVYADIQTRVAALKAIASDATSTRDLLRDTSLLRLKDEVKTALTDMSKQIAKEAAAGQQTGITIGRKAGIAQLDTVATAFNRPSVEAVRHLINYVDSPAFKAELSAYPDYHAQHVSDIVLADYSMGRGPLATARHVAQYLENMPIADARRMVRTVTLWSARKSSHEVYRQNADIVSGWRWSASLDRHVCLSCVALHGKVFPLDQVLNDHHNGRCAPVPITRFTGNVQPGVEWFDDLPERDQRGMMGPAMFSAYKDGMFTLDDVPTTYTDPIYGQMKTAKSLTGLIGADAAKAYRRPAV